MNKPREKPCLLIVEDDPGLRSQLRWHFEQYDVIMAENREEAIAAIRKHEPAVVLQDLGLPPDEAGVSEGFATLQETLKIAPNTKIVVVTGNAEYNSAIRAVALGAYDFYQKPVNTDTLDLIVQRAFQMYQLETEVRRLQQTAHSPLDGIIASDEKMRQICRTLEKIAPTDVTVLLLGESGTGKEVLARAIHNVSPRREQRFVAINCAAVPESLMESELFGHEKGSFTGAHKRSIGRIEHAHNGTLFLDEIGDMPLPLQAKLLRFLQERVIERVGGREEIAVDVRVVCATNKPLKKMVAEGTFREDLYYRIAEVVINIPPLREREGDKILLARFFLNRFAEEMKKPINGFTAEASSAIEAYEWPGNIREMENRVKRAVIMADERLVSTMDMGLEDAPSISFNLRAVRFEAERAAILKAFSMADGNVSLTAKLLGVARPTLYDLVKKYDINLPSE